VNDFILTVLELAGAWQVSKWFWSALEAVLKAVHS
jgi:hypothetical protein